MWQVYTRPTSASDFFNQSGQFFNRTISRISFRSKRSLSTTKGRPLSFGQSPFGQITFQPDVRSIGVRSKAPSPVSGTKNTIKSKPKPLLKTFVLQIPIHGRSPASLKIYLCVYVCVSTFYSVICE
jgi:hypothetical protein